MVFAALVLGLIAAVAAVLLPRVDDDLKWILRPIRFVTGLVATVMLVASPIRIVRAGHVGVRVLFGSVRPIVLSEGIHLTNPFYSVVEMSIRVQKVEGAYDSASRDMQTVHAKTTINYHLRPDRAAEVYQKVGENFQETIIDPACQEVLKAETAKHVASEILQRRSEIKTEVQAALAKWIGKYGFTLKEVAITNISFDPGYAQAIERKQVQEQLAEQKRYELIKTQREAEIAAAKAKGEGDAAKALAQGQAEATRIRGEAEADYNQKVSRSLSAVLIQQQYLTKWDGALPQYMLGSNAATLIQLPRQGATP